LGSVWFSRFVQPAATVQSRQCDPENFNNAALVLIGRVLIDQLFCLFACSFELLTHLMDGMSVNGRIGFGVSSHR
jgi:hypothetical protein